MTMLGDVPEPYGFRYREIFLKGKPQHAQTDAFRLRHPCMDISRRAKIFAPFDALKGFSEALDAVDARDAADAQQADGQGQGLDIRGADVVE